ncbi:hypothetical protein BC938DRAFT_482618 [Jimgerdemannia flammicorona]|uniref:Uncharacterized protein n=1 Tax=Jimgerdemannia flammicorona TaxID=994334 RepID=A0A433QDP6_9FUNG|nr:hypothetical protein BC938DRAFT_482618 [Jimgerdemannia flammicorona]
MALFSNPASKWTSLCDGAFLCPSSAGLVATSCGNIVKEPTNLGFPILCELWTIAYLSRSLDDITKEERKKKDDITKEEKKKKDDITKEERKKKDDITKEKDHVGAFFKNCVTQ